MANVADVGKAITTSNPVHPLKDLIEKSAKELGRALPEHMRPERVVRIALTCVTQNPALAECTPQSFMGSLFVLSQLGLEPINGRAYLLPFNNSRKVGNEWRTVKEVQALIGYKGYVELFYRHDAALAIDMKTVHANDEFSYEYGTNSFLRHRPAMKERGEQIGYYAVAKLRGGASVFHYMSKEDCLDHGRKHSKTYDKKENKFHASSPWAKEPDAMCMKTVLLQLSKMLPLSVELQKAISIDETSRDFRDGVSDAIDLPDTTTWNEPLDVKPTITPEERSAWGEDPAPQGVNGDAFKK